MSAFVVSNIKPSLKVDANQRFIFGLDEFPEPLGSFKLDNIFTPVVGTPSVTNFETRNKDLSGFRWIHTTNAGDTFGSYKLQSFVNAQNTGTDILLFNQDGTVTFNQPVSFPGFAITGDLDMNSHKIINLADPVNAQDAATKSFVETLVGSGTITLSGAVSGTGQVGTDITTTLNTVAIDKLAGYPTDSSLFLRGDGTWSNNFAKIGINFDPTEDGVIQFANGTKDAKIILNKDVPSNPWDISAIGYLSTWGTLYHTPIGKSHLFFTGANGNLGLEISPLTLKVGYGISSVDFRKLVFYEGIVDSNPNQTYAIGVELDGTPNNHRNVRTQVQTINDAFRWCYGIDANTSGEWMRLSNAGLNLYNKKLFNLLDPVDPQDAATRGYVDNLVANLPALVNVTGTSQTFQFNSATAKFILANTTSPSVNEYQVNFGGSIGGLRMGVSGDSPSNQFSYINTSGGSPIYLQSDGVTKMYMNGQGSFVVGTSPVGFPYAKFDIHGGELNVLNEESVIRATSSTNSSKIEINNTSASGRLYELRSNSDGTFYIVDRTSIVNRFQILADGQLRSANNALAHELILDNSNNSAYATGLFIKNNGLFRAAFGYNTSTNETYMWSYLGGGTLKFGVNGNKVIQILNNGNLDMINHSIINLVNPTNPQDATTKAYVDNSITNFTTSNPITLTGAVTGINSINNPIFTTFASTIPVSGASQIFNFSLNSNVVYRLNNTLAATTGTPSTIALSLNNATNGGYRLLHTSTSTDPAGLGTLKLQALNSSGVTADVFTASVNSGNGITDTLFNSTATFNNAVTIQNNQSLIVTGNSGVADYLVMNNTNLSSKTQLRINVTGLPVATFGYDATNSQIYIDSPFGAGSPFVIKFGGTIKFSMDNSTGNIGIGGNTSPNAPLQFGSSTANRKIVLYETANNDHQYYGFGINNGLLRYQIDSIFASHAWYAATSNTTSNELMRLNGNGQLTFSKSDSLSSIIFNNTNPASFANEIMFLNNGNFAGAFGFNNGSNEAYVWAYGTAALKFGTAATERFRITPTGDAVFQNTIYGRRVSGLMTMQNNAIGTTVTTAGTYYKVAGTTVTSNLNGLSSPTSNRLTVTSTIPHIALINVSFTADHNGGGGEETTFALYKNGLQLSNTLISSQAMNDLLALSITTNVSMNTNDYIELWCTSPNNGRIITVKRLLFTYTTT